MKPLLQVDNLSIGFGDSAPVIDNVSFSVNPGETLALVGESGSGKTLSCRAVLRILPRAAQIRAGSIMFNRPDQAIDLFALGERKMRSVRGGAISMIFQEPMRSLSPLHRIGNQVAEVLRIHGGLRARAAKEIVLQTFERVGFPDPARVFSAYPFELSGGMRQRAMIAMAMVAKPELLIADEPTTALDVTIEAQILDLLADLKRSENMSLLFITHDLGVVRRIADRVYVMQQGVVVEHGPTDQIFDTPKHAYTQLLLDAETIGDPAPVRLLAMRCLRLLKSWQ